ncbi:proliferation disrupter [Carabus blaptoides fortunei]
MNLLNSVGDGPHLTVDEWKKRFADWKYAIRAKYRKISEHRNRTGSGPQSDIKLSPLEERALSAWGKVVVTGTPFVSNYDGVNLLSDEELLPSDVNINSVAEGASIIFVNDASGSSTFVENDMLPTTPTRTNITAERTKITEVLTTTTNVGKKRNRIRPKPLSVLTEKLLESNEKNESMHKELNDTIKTFCEKYIQVKSEKLKLEAKKINFEIAKYEYENPNFVFQHK